MKKLIPLILLFAFAAAACTFDNGGPKPSGSVSETTPSPTPFVTPAPIERKTGSVTFSIDENFFNSAKQLELSAEGASKIYYSLDGSTPDNNSEEYKRPIILRSANKVSAICITARALYPDGTWSDPCVRTYFTGSGADKRYDCLVISLTTDPANLWDYDIGIFTGGRILDEYLKEHPGTDIDGSTPANYNALRGMDGERDVNVEIFTPDGELILEQSAGMRTYGGWSRQSDMKSVKLLARKEYGAKNFKYPFFETALDENGEIIDVFKRLVIRAFGNDNGFAFIREELFQSLAMDAGYLGKSVRPCALYINGDYYGAYFLEENWHKSYFENHFGSYRGALEILEGAEMDLKTEDEESQYAADEYNRMYQDFAYRDLRDDAVFEELCRNIDVQNYLEYYAFRILIGDNDWPNNNYKAYRYYAAPGEEYGEAPYDGKWRYLLHDMDFSSGIYDNKVTDRSYTWILGRLDGVKDDISPLFGRLMQRADCKEIFISKMLQLINGVFAKDYFNEHLDAMNESRLHEQHYSYTSGKIAGWVREDQLEGRLNSLKNWIEKRTTYMYNQTYSFFRLGGKKYDLALTVPEGAEITVGGWTVQDDFEGSYLSDYAVKISGKGGINGNIIGWEVNGTVFEIEELVIDSGFYESLTIPEGSGTEVNIRPLFEIK